MTPEELVVAVEELGWSWTLVADYVVRDERTLRRWRRGDNPIPQRAADAIRNRPRALAFELWIRSLG